MTKLHQPDGSILTVNPEAGRVFLGELSDRGIYEKSLDPQTAVILGQALIHAGQSSYGERKGSAVATFIIVVAISLLLFAALL